MQKFDTKVLSAAENMIERYGEDALLQVEQRIAELELQGEADALELWRLVREAVKFLIQNPPGGTQH